jgi:hypothetical protein
MSVVSTRTSRPISVSPLISSNNESKAASQGKLIILLASNVNPRASGHVSVLMPESKQIQAVRENNKVVGVVQSQAGATNFKLDNHRKQWWKDKKHTLGAAWIFEGRPSSPLLPPEQLGYRGS